MICLLVFIQMINYSRCSFSFADLSNEFKKYNLISTKLNKLNGDPKNFTNGSLWCFPLQLDNDLANDEMCIRQKHARVWNPATNITIHDINTNEHLFIQHLGLIEGFVRSDRHSNYVTGFISNEFFYGKINYQNNVNYVEELRRFPWLQISSDENVLVFQSDSGLEKTHDWMIEGGKKSRGSYTDEKLFKMMIGKGKLCTLLVVLDYSFLVLVHKNNVDSAVKYAFSSIEEANSLFRSTDFDNDGSPDNIGFYVKYCIILKSENSAMNLLPKYSTNAIDGKLFLNMFSRYTLLNEVCLGVVFTGQAFTKNIVGISYSAVPINLMNHFTIPLGGICDRPFMENPVMNLNTLAVTAKGADGNIIPKYIFDLSLSHELGHSFGSDHDEGEHCEGFLMSDHTPQNFDRKHFVFSSCSKQNMLNTIVNKGHCFRNDDSFYCGNGRIESSEECDCGTIRDCEAFDACCIPRGKPNSCRIRKDKGFQCHPSQGLCCSSKCQFKDLSIHNLDCVNFQKSCPCKDRSKCSCGIQGKCFDDTCHSNECSRIQMIECVCSHQETTRMGKCSTCCLFNGSCLPAGFLTSKLMENSTFVEKPIGSETKSIKNIFYKVFCNLTDNQCKSFDFREAKPGEYCLLFGELGICNESYECKLPESNLKYPDIPVVNKRVSGTNDSLNLSLTYDLLSMLFLFLLIQ